MRKLYRLLPLSLAIPVGLAFGASTMTGLAFAQTPGARPLTVEHERSLRPKDGFKECDDCPEMLVVPAGSFTMGSPDSEEYRGKGEGPQHVVTFERPFAVGKFEVTIEQFAAFVRETAHDVGSTCWTIEDGKIEEGADRSWRNPGYLQDTTHPAACLNWGDAKAYVAWLSKKTNKDYRLLTEAEWEYVARAQTTPEAAPPYQFGDDEKSMCGYGNGADQTAKNTIPNRVFPALIFFSCSDGYVYSAPVGSFSANGFGLHDVHGNVWEWTEDCYNDSYRGAPTDGSAWTAGDCHQHIIRGGSWFNGPNILRSAHRTKTSFRSSLVGLRVARTLPP